MIDGARVRVRRNFVLNALDGALYALAMSLAARTTVLPLFVQKLGGGDVAVGLIPVVWMVGLNLPQIAIAGFAERAPVKKRLLLWTAAGQRLPWLLLAGVGYLASTGAPEGRWLSLFFIVFAFAAVGSSLNYPVWFDLVSKVTPVRLRGRLFSVRLVSGSLLGVLGGGIVGWTLKSFSFPFSFTLLFGLAFGVMAVSYVCLVLLDEPASETGEQAAPGHRRGYGALPFVLLRDRNYRNFVVSEAMLVTTI